MSAAGARFDSYQGPHGPEFLIARGPAKGPQLLVVQALFEEANFTRSLAADLQRAAAAAGVSAWLCDLPGHGDSLAPLEQVRLADWRIATAAAAARVEAASGRRPHLATIRGGALLAEAARARSCWRLAPVDGPGLLRPLTRASVLGGAEGLAGWPAGEGLVDDLRAAALPDLACPIRDAAWEEGAPPWRRAEPARDAAASARLAADLVAWIERCDVS